MRIIHLIHALAIKFKGNFPKMRFSKSMVYLMKDSHHLIRSMIFHEIKPTGRWALFR